ncbi:MAG TPA: hypothetical protein VEU62_20645 [Bryobacterales bacterium]|nr:hypothetical protein [Bryobacterales bacterium]
MRSILPALLLCLAAQLAPAATLERLTLEQMTRQSTEIVRARAGAISAVAISSMIYTRTQFQVLDRWKGPNNPEVSVMEPGGTVGRTTQTYSGVPHFTPGQELVLFLWTGPSGRTQVIGLTQGLFEVVPGTSGAEPFVNRKPSGETMLAPGTKAPAPEEEVSMPLSKLVFEIQAALGTSRQP